MDLARWLKHLILPGGWSRRSFPEAIMARVEAAIAASEAGHRGEIRVAVETTLDLPALWRGQTARQRALELFAALGVWDTEENNGVLIYLLLADRDVEIVADRGLAGRVPEAEWEALCWRMEARLRAGEHEAGLLEGVAGVDALLRAHYPRQGTDANELPDRPVRL